jgi:hypothetical protein
MSSGNMWKLYNLPKPYLAGSVLLWAGRITYQTTHHSAHSFPPITFHIFPYQVQASAELISAAAQHPIPGGPIGVTLEDGQPPYGPWA